MGHTLNVMTIRTPLGWLAALGDDGVLHQLTMGHASAPAALRAIEAAHEAEFHLANWNGELAEMLKAFAAGEAVEFNAVRIELSHLTDFQQCVVRHCRRIPLGRTLSYGELAVKAGSPRAARAVGSVMAMNRYPLIVPCHRVVAAGGRLGGFSAPQGLQLKRRLLDLEQSMILAAQ